MGSSPKAFSVSRRQLEQRDECGRVQHELEQLPDEYEHEHRVPLRSAGTPVEGVYLKGKRTARTTKGDDFPPEPARAREKIELP